MIRNCDFVKFQRCKKTISQLLQAGAAENPEVLTLYNVTEKDAGWYTCIAQNNLGETFSSAYLRVVDCKS